MAGGSLGKLTVSLGLDAAEFVGGLNKADYQARLFSDKLASDLSKVALIAGGAFSAIAAAAGAAFKFADSQAQAISQFQDMAEKIGDSAVAISSLRTAADVSETSLSTITAASVKLTVALAKQDEESKGAAQALKALNLNFDDFKRLSPVEQLDAVAQSLIGFQDGASKTAIAVALFGKAGAELLPFLNDLADGSQRYTRLTAEAIAEADKFTKELARIKSESSQATQVIAGPLISAINRLIERFRLGQREGENFLEVMARFNNPVGLFKSITGFGSAAKNGFTEAREELESLQRRLNAFQSDGTQVRERSRDLGVQSMLRKEIELRAKLDSYLTGERMNGRSDPRSLGLPELDTSGLSPVEKAAKAARATDPTTTPEYKQALRDAEARQELRIKEDKDIEKFFGDQRIEAQKTAEALKKAQADRLQGMLDKTPTNVLEQQRRDVKALTDEYEAGRISEELYLEAVTERLDLTAQKTKETKSLAEELGLSFTSAFESAIQGGKGLGDVLKGLAGDLLALAVRKNVTEPLFAAASSSGFFSSLAGLFGGGKAAGGPVGANRLYEVGENGAETYDVGGKQFLLTGSKSGIVRPGVDSGGGGGPLVINVGAGASRNEVIAAVQTGIRISVGTVADARRRSPRGAL